MTIHPQDQAVVEEFTKNFADVYEHDGLGPGEDGFINSTNVITNWLTTTLTTLRQQTVEEAKREEREKVEKDIVTICQQYPLIAHSESLIKRYRALTQEDNNKKV